MICVAADKCYLDSGKMHFVNSHFRYSSPLKRIASFSVLFNAVMKGMDGIQLSGTEMPVKDRDTFQGRLSELDKRQGLSSDFLRPSMEA